MYDLQSPTPLAWVAAVQADFDAFLIDHASCERKASGLAMSLVAHYPDRTELVRAMMDLAIEELAHFREVMKLALARGLTFSGEEKDPYVNALRQQVRSGKAHYLMDRLLIFSIVERRGAERFGLLGEHLDDAKLRDFYARLARAEDRHYTSFLRLANTYFDAQAVDQRLATLLAFEAELVNYLPHRAAVH